VAKVSDQIAALTRLLEEQHEELMAEERKQSENTLGTWKILAERWPRDAESAGAIPPDEGDET
jgi:hypothetical protein